jgi:ATP-dependent helicase HepA
LTALSSASVEFVPHQIAAVRRILTDPIQRYLLADEVGLGKTIEAALVVRQHLIDEPRTKVVIAVPSQLLEQWRSELSNECGSTNSKGR